MWSMMTMTMTIIVIIIVIGTKGCRGCMGEFFELQRKKGWAAQDLKATIEDLAQ